MTRRDSSPGRRAPLRRALPLAALLLAAVAAPAVGQGVTGSVVDASTGAPLPGVLVSLLAGPGGGRLGAALSDAEGRFTLRAGGGTRVSVRAERIGLATVTLDALTLPAGALHPLRIEMTDAAVEIDGIVVDTRVQQCRANPVEAASIQRWWDEIRKALEVSSVVQRDRLARFRIQRFTREWSPDLRSVSGEETELQIGFSSRPFVSMAAERLSRDGFVQGDSGDRDFYAPDADVLLSDVFLSDHCFSAVTDDDRPGWIGIHFEPVRTRKIPEVIGTLWVDTRTAELQLLDFRYANLDWLPSSEAGGEVRFDYLPSGTWIVSDWHIRMPRVGVRAGLEAVGGTEVAGYVDVGGRVRQLTTLAGEAESAEGTAIISGTVFDSIAGGPLHGARVAVLGTRFAAVTDADGRFELAGLPAGSHRIGFFHETLTLWGAPTRTVATEVEDGGRAETALAVPRFRTLAGEMCPGITDAQTVLTGHLVDGDGEGVEGARLDVHWEVTEGRTGARTFDAFATTGSGGRFRVCGVPAEARLEVRLAPPLRGEATTLVLPGGEVTYREIRARR